MTQEKGNWREICEAMVKELDPARMFELAAQLVTALDKQKMVSPPPARANKVESLGP